MGRTDGRGRSDAVRPAEEGVDSRAQLDATVSLGGRADIAVKSAQPGFMIDQLALRSVRDMVKGIKTEAEFA
jgi:hypothetical protein